MDPFYITIELVPENRKTIQASLKGNVCAIKFPKPWLNRKRYLAPMVDRIYWRLLGRIYNRELQRRTIDLNDKYFGFYYKIVTYHRQFRRWGSCSSLRNIHLSHRLIEAPQTLQDYVIIHELAHLEHLNHSRDFWSLVKTTGFDPKIIRREIEIYGRAWNTRYFKWYEDLLKKL